MILVYEEKQKFAQQEASIVGGDGGF